ncbi:hypothetical protein CAPTEDRAFT_26353, partial [Capitella teleta]
SEIKNGAFWRDLLAELLATFFLVAAQCALPLSYDDTGSARIGTALGMGFVVLSIGWCFGDFSGAHMNPAVTMTLLLRMKITFLRAFFYWIVQCGGAIGAAFAIKSLVTEDMAASADLALTKPAAGIEPWKGMLFEMVLTAILCFTVHGATNVKRKGMLFINTLPIGMALALGILMGLPVTGGSLNPARSLGPVVAQYDVDGIWDDHWIYWAGPMLGAIVAAIVYSLL